MESLSLLISYLASLAAGADTDEKVQEIADHLREVSHDKWRGLPNIDTALSLKEHVHNLPARVARIPTEAGDLQGVEEVFTLFNDPVFQTEFANWMIHRDEPEGESAKD